MLYRETPHFEEGEEVIWCSLPDPDYWDGAYHWVIVDFQQPDGQVILTSGSQTHAKYLWRSVREIEDYLLNISLCEQADAQLMRQAIG